MHYSATCYFHDPCLIYSLFNSVKTKLWKFASLHTVHICISAAESAYVRNVDIYRKRMFAKSAYLHKLQNSIHFKLYGKYSYRKQQ